MTRKLKPIQIQETLKEKGIRLFSPEELRRLFSVTLRASQEFIKDHQVDLFIKLRNGLYGLKSDLLPPYTLVHLDQKKLVAEKIQACLTRAKARDFYDVYFILRSRMAFKNFKSTLFSEIERNLP